MSLDSPKVSTLTQISTRNVSTDFFSKFSIGNHGAEIESTNGNPGAAVAEVVDSAFSIGRV